MPTVLVRDQNIDLALRRFKRACEKANTAAEYRRRTTYEKPTTARKREKAAAIKRLAKKIASRDKRHTEY